MIKNVPKLPQYTKSYWQAALSKVRRASQKKRTVSNPHVLFCSSIQSINTLCVKWKLLSWRHFDRNQGSAISFIDFSLHPLSRKRNPFLFPMYLLYILTIWKGGNAHKRCKTPFPIYLSTIFIIVFLPMFSTCLH